MAKQKDELKILFSIYIKKDSLTSYYDFPCDSTNILYDQNLSTNNLELVNPNIILYPNPSNDFITIKNLSNYALSHIVIRDLNGKIVYSKKVNSKQINIDVSFLQKGAYFVDCIIEGTRKTLKLIKL